MPLFAKEKRPMPPTVATDEIIPVHLFDGSGAARSITMVWTFKFDDVLDPDAIHDSLTELFQMDGWRKFSGRFRLRPDGKLEIHVPEKSTEARPAVFTSRENHDFPMAEHPLASTLPKATGPNLATFKGPQEFTPLALGPETPRNLEDYIYTDKPQFCLHIQTFTDGTLLGFTHSHITTDLGGFVALLDAWTKVLAKRPEEVAPFVGYRDDPLVSGMLYPPAKESHMLADKVLNGWRFKYWAMRSMYESWRADDIQARTVCVPGHLIDAMVEEAKSSIPPGGGSITTGDVLAAAACLIRARAEGPNSSREVMTMMALNPRGRVTSVFRPDSAYVQNSPTNIHFACNANKALKLPLGHLALLVRESIIAQSQEEQMRASAALSVETMKTNDQPVIFGTKDMAAIFMSNWAQGRFSERMDFSPAVVKDAGTPRPSPDSQRGHPVHWSVSDPEPKAISVISCVFVVVGDDAYRNTWLTITLPKDMWSDFLTFLSKYDKTNPGNDASRYEEQIKSKL